MADLIAPQIIPSWAVSSLGKKVCFVKNYDFYGDGSDIYSAGTIATLDGIQFGKNGTEAVVSLFDDDELLLNPSFDYLRIAE